MGTLVPTIGNAVGAVAPVISTAQTAANFIGLNNAGRADLQAQQQQALNELRQKQALQAKQLTQDNALDRERIAATAAADERERRNALKRVVASQQARFGAQGVGANSSGSVQAVLLGAFDESEEERQNREQLNRIRTRALDQSESQLSSINILQRSQLEERQRLERALNRSESRSNGFFGNLF
ncbi:MAG: hypothetical protein AAF182_00620 [Pseudomonadota bacterium]